MSYSVTEHVVILMNDCRNTAIDTTKGSCLSQVAPLLLRMIQKKYVGLEVVEVIMFLYLSMYTLAYTGTRYNENTGSRDSQ